MGKANGDNLFQVWHFCNGVNYMRCACGCHEDRWNCWGRLLQLVKEEHFQLSKLFSECLTKLYKEVNLINHFKLNVIITEEKHWELVAVPETLVTSQK